MLKNGESLCLLTEALSEWRGANPSISVAQDHKTDDGASFKVDKTFLTCGRGAEWILKDICFTHSIKFTLDSAQIVKDEGVNGIKALFVCSFT